MAASPWHTPLLNQTERRHEEASSPQSTPALTNLNLDWKTPLGGRKRRRQSPPPAILPEEDEVENAILLPTLTWNKPTITSQSRNAAAVGLRPEDEVGRAGPSSTSGKLEVKSVPPPTASTPSSSHCPYEDDGDFELESVLLDEEEFNVPQHNRHRTRTGIRGIDEVLTLESSEWSSEKLELVVEEEGLSCGSILEVIGTPGSGKTAFLTQTAVRERLSSLQRVRRNAGKGKGIVKVEEEDEWLIAIDAAVQVTLIGEHEWICKQKRHST